MKEVGLSSHPTNIDFSKFKVNLFKHEITEIMLAPPVCASNHALDLFCPTSSLLFITWGSSSPQLDTSDSTTWKMQDRHYLRLMTCWRFWWKNKLSLKWSAFYKPSLLALLCLLWLPLCLGRPEIQIKHMLSKQHILTANCALTNRVIAKKHASERICNPSDSLSSKGIWVHF